MGYHYTARPVEARDLARAMSAPKSYTRETPTCSSDSALVLELGRCWRCLQLALGAGTPGERLSAELVRTPASHSGLGLTSLARVLTPAEVAAIADDLEEILNTPDARVLTACLFEFPRDAIRSRLSEALSFTQALAERGQGLAYVIGAEAQHRSTA